jgi:hypothetical protein
MIRHVVFFKFKTDAGEEQRAAAMDALGSLPGKIDFIRDFEVGLDLVRSPRAWDGALVSTFDDLDALNRYATHADHLPVVEIMKATCEAIGSVDFEID